MLRTEVMEYYRRRGEVSRLTTGRGRLEFLRTWDVLTRFLPPAPATVLDVGGATGAYAGPLAAQGYRVHVVDPVPEHTELAAELPGVTASVGNALALGEADDSVDAVLLFGPLYHLIDRGDRLRVWREAARVVRPGGVILAATISRFASIFSGFSKGHFADPRFAVMVDRALSDGVHTNVGPGREYFTTAYFHHPDEPAAEAQQAGLDAEHTIALENALWIARDEDLDELLDDPCQRDVLLALLRRIENEPSTHGASSHLITIARPLQDPRR